MTTPHIRRVDASASEFFVTTAVATRVSAMHGGWHRDIDGALEAGQYGAAFVATRLALHNALFLHLARERKVGALPPDLRALGDSAFELLEAHDPGGELQAQAWRLERVNPMTPDEVESFAAQYRRFFSGVLQLDAVPLNDAMMSDATFGAYLECADELSTAFEHLGLQGINLADARARMARRAAVNSHLAGDPGVGRDAQSAPEGLEGQARNAAPGEEPVAVGVTLTGEDVRLVQRLLREHASQLEQRIPETDGRDERCGLLADEERCRRLSRRLDDASVGAAPRPQGLPNLNTL